MAAVLSDSGSGTRYPGAAEQGAPGKSSDETYL